MWTTHFKYTISLALVLLAGVVAVACGGAAATPTATLTPTSTAQVTPAPTDAAPVPASSAGPVGGRVGNRAPEFQEIASWINSEALTMEGLRGQVVLVDFWTYTCINCIRTFPYLREWYAKYADRGLTIVGVHSPEFEFEKVRENVVRSAGEHGLTYAIAQDNEFGTWGAYSNRYWPAKYLIDRDGVVRYTHFGEGDYDVTEREIRKLLEEAGADLSNIQAGADPGPEFSTLAAGGGVDDGLTRELYAGYDRHVQGGPYILHTAYFGASEQVVQYQDPGGHLNNFIYLQGLWFNGLESLVHARQTGNYEDYIAVKFAATSVNAVITLQDASGPFEVVVTINGRPLRPEEAGADVVVEGERSFFVVNEPRLYQVVELPAYGSHELRLSSNSPEFALFAFTFGAYDEGP